jgi:hypothetical protein
MRRLVRENAFSAGMAAVATATMAWLALYGYAFTDYQNEAQPAFNALLHGHLEQFLRLAPAYGGSLIERAPFALLPGLWGGGALAVYRAVSIPCLVAAALLGVWSVAYMRSSGRTTRLARAVALALFVANPITMRALELGHPEEVLGAVLCVAAVLAATRGHTIWAGLALGLAIANKEWALVAAGPVVAGLPGVSASTRAHKGARDARHALLAACARPAACLAIAAGVTAALLAPLALAPGAHFVTGANVAASGGPFFEPWQVWWFLGHPAVAHAIPGVPHSDRHIAPAWVHAVSHPSVVLASILFTALLLWARRRHPEGHSRVGDALLLLALAMLARCMLDTWDNLYYSLPLVFALTTWEATALLRVPALALTVTVLLWASFVWTSGIPTGDVLAAIYLAWTVPLAAGLAWRLYAPVSTRRAIGRLTRLLPRWALDSRAWSLPGLPAPRA